jgi:hypothetical protein
MTGLFLYDRLDNSSVLMYVNRPSALYLIFDMMMWSDMFLYNSWLDMGFMMYCR